MDSYPEDFNANECLKRYRVNQVELMKNVRLYIFKRVNDHVNRSITIIKLEIDSNLFEENKKKIIKELLTRFGELKISTTGTNGRPRSGVTKIITDIKDLLPGVRNVVIDFGQP